MLLPLLLIASFMHTHRVDALCAASAWRLPTWPTKQLRPTGMQLLHAASQLSSPGVALGQPQLMPVAGFSSLVPSHASRQLFTTCEGSVHLKPH